MIQARIFIPVIALATLSVLAGCSSAQREREEQRNRLSASSGMYCEFINGDEFQDIDVELNMSMAKRCDSSKPFTLTSYKNSSDVNGLLYCCAIVRKEVKHATPVAPAADILDDIETPAPETRTPPAIAKPDPNAKKPAPVVPPVVETKKKEQPAPPVPMKAAPAAAPAAPAPAPAPAAPAPQVAPEAPASGANNNVNPSSRKPASTPSKPAPKKQPMDLDDDGDIL